MMVQTRFFSLLFLCALLTVGCASPLGATSNDGATKGKVTANINNVFDSLIPSIQTFVIKSGLDPMELEDISENLETLLHQKHLNLTNGWLQGLSEMKRTKDVILSYEDKILTLDVTLGFRVLHANYDYLYKHALIKREGVMHSRVQNIEIRVVLELDFKNYKLVLRTLKIVRIDKIQLKLQGHVIDPVLNAAIKGFTTVFRKRLTCMVEKKSSEMLLSMLNKVNEKIPHPDKMQESNAVFDFIPGPRVSLLA